MLLRLAQVVIFFAVAFSNIRWRWTENQFAAGVAGVVAAYAITTWPLILWDKTLLLARRAGLVRWPLPQDWEGPEGRS